LQQITHNFPEFPPKIRLSHPKRQGQRFPNEELLVFDYFASAIIECAIYKLHHIKLLNFIETRVMVL